MTSEYDLVQNSQRSPEAFRELYRLYFPRVYAYIAYRLPSVQDAEDVAADTFTRVVEGLHKFEYRGQGSFAAWVFRIAHSQVHQFYRQRGQAQISVDDLPEIESEQLTPDQFLQRRERFAHLAKLVRLLPPRRQEVITLKFFGGLRNQEIAQILGLDERTVASHLCRALDDLRSQFEPEKEPE